MAMRNSRSSVKREAGIAEAARQTRAGWSTRTCRVIVVLALAASILATKALADEHTTGVPELNSLEEAPYTLYLDFTGFNFTGAWGMSGSKPGNTPALDNVAGSFDSAEQDKIKQIWARVAQCYTPFNVNVTTIDPAVAAGRADTDAHRQAYYDQTMQLMHTVIGEQQNNWFGEYGGVSYIDVAAHRYGTVANGGAGAGWKTNWVFTDGVGTGKSCGQAAAHENGHGLSLCHQGDYNGNTLVNEYSYGDNNNGNGTYGPIMGAAYNTQRGAWRVGDATDTDSNHFIQNDVQALLSNSGIGGFVDDGIGHTLAMATPMPLSGNTVDFTQAKGVITPASTSAPTPIGASNYTTDFFSFYTAGGLVTLTAYDGSEFLNPGTPDPGAMLRSTLTILDSSGSIVGTATEADSTLFETFSAILPAGGYYAKIASYGGHVQTLAGCNTTEYFDMGSYFLTGSGFAVPEPGTWAMLASVLCLALVQKKCKVVRSAAFRRKCSVQDRPNSARFSA
jgi:hypothetical protein